MNGLTGGKKLIRFAVSMRIWKLKRDRVSTGTLAAGTSIGLSTVAPPVFAQAFPNKPIRFLVPYPVGGIVDIVARAVTEPMQADLGQPIVVEPKPGGNSTLATAMIPTLPADGYTWLMATISHVVVPHLQAVSYDALADFRPVALVAVATSIAVVNPALPVKTLADVIAFNEAHRDREMAWFGQELFTQAQALGGLDTPAYREALALCRRQSRDEGLDKVFQAHRLDALVAIGRTNIELRQLSVPPAPDDELPDMVRFQALREFNQMEEDWALDYVPIDEDPTQPRTVLAAAIAPEQIELVRKTCQAAGLRPRRLVLLGGLVLTAGLLASSLATQLWHMVILYGVVMTLVGAFIVMSATLNIFMTSGSAQWALMAPVFVPMLMMIDFDPAFVLAMFRIGDSSTNIISPMSPYFSVALVYMQRYKPDMGLGTLIATMLPLAV